VARGPDAATLLDSTDTRNKIVNELMEVCHLGDSVVQWLA